MAKKKRAASHFVQGMGILNLLSDRHWITIFSALAADRSPEAQALLRSLMARTKHGRQLRLLQLIEQKRPRVSEMQKLMKVSRRTIFRDLIGLEEYGVKLSIDGGFRYGIERIPDDFKRFI